MTSHSLYSFGFLYALIVLYFIVECHGGNSETELKSNLTEVSRSDSKWDVATGRGYHHHKHKHLLSLVYDFIVIPIANLVVAIGTLLGGGVAGLIVNVFLAVAKHFFGFLWKAFKLWLTVHSFGWGWGPSFDHHHHGWRSDSGHESIIL